MDSKSITTIIEARKKELANDKLVREYASLLTKPKELEWHPRASQELLKKGYMEKAASEKQVGGDHYKDCEIQPSEYIVKNGLGWYEGNAVKYITRHKKKGGRESILKAIHYLELLLEAEYPKD